MPQRRQNSSVRMPVANILASTMRPSPCSMSVHGTPRQPSSIASARPTGPPPTINTGVSTAQLERLAVQVFGALHADQHRVALLLRIAVLLGLDELLPHLVVDLAGAVQARAAVEADDPALGQNAGLAQLGLAQEYRELGAVLQQAVGRALAALPQRKVLVVVHHGAAARADLRVAVGHHHAHQADVGGKRAVDVLVQDFRNHVSSRRTRAAPWASDCSLAKATARGRYFMPQSGATTSRSAGTCFSPARMRSATACALSTASLPRSITPSMTLLPPSSRSTARSSRGCAASIEICEALVSASCGRKE